MINAGQIEDLQKISDVQELERIFIKARSALVNGALVYLVRKNHSGVNEIFDELTTLENLDQYKNDVFKYL